MVCVTKHTAHGNANILNCVFPTLDHLPFVSSSLALRRLIENLWILTIDRSLVRLLACAHACGRPATTAIKQFKSKLIRCRQTLVCCMQIFPKKSNNNSNWSFVWSLCRRVAVDVCVCVRVRSQVMSASLWSLWTDIPKEYWNANKYATNRTNGSEWKSAHRN